MLSICPLLQGKRIIQHFLGSLHPSKREGNLLFRTSNSDFWIAQAKLMPVIRPLALCYLDFLLLLVI